MNLDPIAERANTPGWTKEAKKAEAERKRVAAKAAGKAWRRAFVGGIAKACGDFWDFILRNILLSLAIGAGIGTGAWEWWNSARGWQDLYPGVGVIAYIGAAGAVISWYVAFRMARLEGRKPKPANPAKREKHERSNVELAGWITAAAFSYVVCVTGVFVATATNSVKAQHAAKESRIERVNMVAKRDGLVADLEVYNPEYWEAMIKQDLRSISSQLNLAIGSLDMLDLEPAGGCAKPKLSFNQRRACVRMNGGVDEFNGEAVLGLQTELERSQRGLKTAKEKAADLAALEIQLKNYRVLTGDETAEALGQMSDWARGETSLALLLLILSSFFLAASGWGNDWAFDELEIKRRAARAASLAKRTT